MADSEIAIQLLEDMIIPACGIKKAGDIVTASDCGDSWQWMLERSRHKVVSLDDVPADAPAEVSEVSEVADEVTTDVSDDVETDSVADADSEVETPVVVPVDVPTDAPEATETEVAVEADAVAKIKEVLGEKKSRIDDIVEDTGLTEDVVVAALTEANGFQKNQQGWWKVVKS